MPPVLYVLPFLKLNHLNNILINNWEQIGLYQMTQFHNIVSAESAPKAGAPNLPLDCDPFHRETVCLVSWAPHTEAAEMGAS